MKWGFCWPRLLCFCSHPGGSKALPWLPAFPRGWRRGLPQVCLCGFLSWAWELPAPSTASHTFTVSPWRHFKWIGLSMNIHNLCRSKHIIWICLFFFLIFLDLPLIYGLEFLITSSAFQSPSLSDMLGCGRVQHSVMGQCYFTKGLSRLNV